MQVLPFLLFFLLLDCWYDTVCHYVVFVLLSSMVFVFRDLERRIVEAEMELTLAKSQGYLNKQLQQSGSSSGKKLLAVIGVYTGFGSRLKRNVFRGSWMPKGQLGFWSLIMLFLLLIHSLINIEIANTFGKVTFNIRSWYLHPFLALSCIWTLLLSIDTRLHVG